MLLHFDENDLKKSLEEEREEGRKELADAIIRLKGGESPDSLLSSGLPEETVNLAVTLV